MGQITIMSESVVVDEDIFGDTYIGVTLMQVMVDISMSCEVVYLMYHTH